MALTTAAQVRSAIPNGSSLSSSVVDDLVLAADAAAKTYLGRVLESASYREFVKAKRVGEPMFVKEYPVTAVTAVNVADSRAFEVWSTHTRATVRVTSTGLALRHFTAGAWVETSLLFATYPTLTLMVAAVAALSDWDATLSTEVTGQEPSDELAELNGPIDVSQSNAKDFYLLDGVVATEWDYESGDFEFTEYGCKEGETVCVRYTGGYTSIPTDVAKGVAILAAEMYARDLVGSGGNLKREKLGQHEEERFQGESSLFTPTVAKLLGPYRERAVLV